MHREVIDKAVGFAEISPKENIQVNDRETWRIKFIAGKKGLATNGSVRFTIPHGFSLPQITAFFDPGFTTIEAPEKFDFELKIVSDIFCRWDKEVGHSGAWGRSVFVYNRGCGMQKGESFTLVYGNQDYYGDEHFIKSGAWARELSGKTEFIVAVDPTGNREYPFTGYAKIKDQPSINLSVGREKLRMGFLPADVYENDELDMLVVSIDEYNNPGPKKETTVSVTDKFVKLDEEMSDTWVPIRINPVRIHEEEPDLKIFWGDIHGHTIHSDGLGGLDDYYEFARDTSKLDFTAVTDHDDIGPKLMDDEWKLTVDAANSWNEKGKLTTFIGHEYRNDLCDMNVYYPSDSGELLCHTDEDLDNAAILTKRVKEQNGMIIPHMHFGADWSGFDPEVYRVIEVYSQHGSAEYPDCPREIPYLRKQVQKSSKTNENCYIHDALNLGYRMGFTAGSDTHSGRPGLSDWTRVCRTYLGGLTAVYAPDNSRKSIWDALQKRRCYATTGNRSILDFQINNTPMGSELELSEKDDRNLFVNCEADGQLYGIKIFRSGKIWIEEEIFGSKLEKTYKDTGRDCSDWYYIRLDLNDAEMVWSSPIWVDIA